MVPILKETVWLPESVWMLWVSGSSFPGVPAQSLVTVLNEWAQHP